VPACYRFTSWTALYQTLLGCFGCEHYHLGEEILGFKDEHGAVTVSLGSGRSIRCDLLVCADGIMSTARQILLPDTTPHYAGYVAWRGTLEAEELAPDVYASLHEAVTYFLLSNSHLLAYPIPPEDVTPTSAKPMNWLWYRNVPQGPDLDDLMTDPSGFRHAVSMPPGQVRDVFVQNLRDAASGLLPPSLAEMVVRTAKPFLQAIVDVEVPRMGFGHVCLIGDAAFALRPHAAVGTATAAEDAWQLGQAMKTGLDDVVAALGRWERGQLALGRQALARTREAGRRFQIEGTWRIGEPLPFGLYREGDSTEIDFDEPSAPVRA
jgi:2,6-dihydroxypyridine 3-monooxygenase